MENKSKELAKILNIKPKYCGSRWDFVDRTYFVDSKIFDTKEEAKEYNNEEEFNVEELNVDFTKPSNFVKLLKLFVDKYPTEICFTSIIEYQIIDMCINFINEKRFTKYSRNIFKQQAQQTEWEYK